MGSEWRPLPEEKNVITTQDGVPERAKLMRTSTYTTMTTRGVEEDINSVDVVHMPEFNGWGVVESDGSLLHVYPDEETAERAALLYLRVISIEC
jgi:hypothetical protein